MYPKKESSFEHRPPWRNWLARSAVNRKVGGSSPPGGDTIFVKIVVFLRSNTGYELRLEKN